MNYLNKEERKQLSLQRKVLRLENKLWPEHLIEVPKERWPEGVKEMERQPESVWRSRFILVQIFREREDPPLRRMTVCRSEVDSFGDWKDNLSWDELHMAKVQCGFGHMDAVEIYPRAQDVVHFANMRHLWIVDGLIPFAWRNGPHADGAQSPPVVDETILKPKEEHEPQTQGS